MNENAIMIIFFSGKSLLSYSKLISIVKVLFFDKSGKIYNSRMMKKGLKLHKAYSFLHNDTYRKPIYKSKMHTQLHNFTAAVRYVYSIKPCHLYTLYTCIFKGYLRMIFKESGVFFF